MFSTLAELCTNCTMSIAAVILCRNGWGREQFCRGIVQRPVNTLDIQFSPQLLLRYVRDRFIVSWTWFIHILLFWMLKLVKPSVSLEYTLTHMTMGNRRHVEKKTYWYMTNKAGEWDLVWGEICLEKNSLFCFVFPLRKCVSIYRKNFVSLI